MFAVKYLVLVVSLLSTIAAAAPLRARTIEHEDLAIREPQPNKSFRTAVNVAKAVRHLKPPPNGAVFWSGTKTGANGKTVSVKADAQKFAKKNGAQTINMALKNKGINIPKSKYEPRLWNIASKAWAKNAKGQTHAVLGGTVRPNSVWNKIEKPTLLKNKQVTKITEHNAETGKKHVTKK